MSASTVPVPNREPLAPTPLIALPLGAIRTQGWLENQLHIQRDGLTGRLPEIWPDYVGVRSGWLGGPGEDWECGPYYCDGMLPLAYLLQDATLIARAEAFVDWTLRSQQPNGYFGPRTNNDWWPRMIMLKVLTQYQEVTGDERVIPFMTKYFAFQKVHDTRGAVPLIKLLSDQNGRIRREAASALHSILKENSEDVDVLILLLKAVDPSLRGEAIEALRKLSDEMEGGGITSDWALK